jgi:hypothetical protein
MVFYISPNVNPSAKEFKPLIEYSGGKVVTTLPKNDQVIVISTTDPKDANLNLKLASHGNQIFTSDFIKNSLMKQYIEYDPCRLEIPTTKKLSSRK